MGVISGEARNNQAKLGGMYILAPDNVNRNRYWYSKSGYYAIWWSNGGHWMVGLYSTLGTSNGGIQGPTGRESWPNQIPTNWKYLDFYFQTANQGDIKFINAGRSKETPPPKKLELILDGDVKDNQKELAGSYHLRDSKVNFYQYWVNNDDKNAIWFSKEVSAWVIGHKSDLGSDNGGIVAPFGEDKWPNNIFRGW